MMKLLSQKEFAALCDVSQASVSQACRTGALRPTLVAIKEGHPKINALHPDALAYRLKQMDRAPTVVTPISRTPQALPDGAPAPESEPLEQRYADWTLSQVVEKFGTGARLTEWLRATKIIVDIHAKTLQARDIEDKTICRELVRQHVFGAINDGNQRLIVDAPKTIARRLSAHARSGGTIEEGERLVREEISKHLRASRGAALQSLEA